MNNKVKTFDLYTRYSTFSHNAVFKNHLPRERFSVVKSAESFIEWFILYRQELMTTTAIHKGNLKDAYHEQAGTDYKIEKLRTESTDGRYSEIIKEMEKVVIKEEWLKSAPAKEKKAILSFFKKYVSLTNGKLKLSAEAVTLMSEEKYSRIRNAKKEFAKAVAYWKEERQKPLDELVTKYFDRTQRIRTELQYNEKAKRKMPVRIPVEAHELHAKFLVENLLKHYEITGQNIK